MRHPQPLARKARCIAGGYDCPNGKSLKGPLRGSGDLPAAAPGAAAAGAWSCWAEQLGAAAERGAWSSPPKARRTRGRRGPGARM